MCAQGLAWDKGDLMLRDDVALACSDNKFHVYAVSNIFEALEVMTGIPAGNPESEYAEGTILAEAVSKARDFWEKTLTSPVQLTSIEAANQGTVPLPMNVAGKVDGESKA